MLAQLLGRQRKRHGHLFDQTLGGAALRFGWRGNAAKLRQRIEDAIGQRNLDRCGRDLRRWREIDVIKRALLCDLLGSRKRRFVVPYRRQRPLLRRR